MRREVFNNIIRFRDNLSEKKPRAAKPRPSKRVYLTLINRHTGDMRFAQKISELEHDLAKHGKDANVDWEEIHLTVEDERGVVHFRLSDVHGKHLKPSHFDALAWKIADETLKALNEIAETYEAAAKEELPEGVALAKVKASSEKHRIEDTPGFVQKHPTRLEAEKMLLDRPIGTYLISRGNETIQEVAKRLSETNGMMVRVYVLTVVERAEKISDILIVHTKFGWTVFADNPLLNSPIYHHSASLTALLEILHHRASKPMII